MQTQFSCLRTSRWYHRDSELSPGPTACAGEETGARQSTTLLLENCTLVLYGAFVYSLIYTAVPGNSFGISVQQCTSSISFFMSTAIPVAPVDKSTILDVF